MVPGGWTSRRVTIGDRSFSLTMPANPDDFLDDEAVIEANRRTDYMPYWASLWSAAPRMARLILNHRWGDGIHALELGAGIGLAGLAALGAGMHVTFSDHDPVAIQAAVHNAIRNGLTNCDSLLLDWKQVADADLAPFPVLLGCDLLYEVPIHRPLLDVINRLLLDDGVCWLADPGRENAVAFRALLESSGYAVELRDQDGCCCSDQPLLAFRLLVITRQWPVQKS